MFKTPTQFEIQVHGLENITVSLPDAHAGTLPIEMITSQAAKTLDMCLIDGIGRLCMYLPSTRYCPWSAMDLLVMPHGTWRWEKVEEPASGGNHER
jgi:hypothetical protein